MSAAIDFIQFDERMVGEASPDYDDTLNRALKTIVDLSGADEDAFVGFALRPAVDSTAGQFYRAIDTTQSAEWVTLVTAMISDLTSASTGITKVGTVNTGAWQGTSIATTYTDAKVKTVTGTSNRLTIGGTATDPTFDVSTSYAGQATIVTLGTVVTGTWNATSIGTAYTDAKVVSISGTSNRVSVAGTATVPVIDISATYVGQTSIVTLGTITTGVWGGTSIGTGFTDAKVVSISGTSSRVSVGGTATVPVIDIDAAYLGQATITTLGTVTTGVWNGTAVATAFTVAQLVSLAGTTNRIDVGGTATAPIVNISTAYVGQATITTLGTITTGSWTGSSIATTYTDAKVKTVTGTSNRLTVGGTATDPTFDVSTSYVGQATITTLGTITTGTWAGTAITVDKGGTNIASFTIGDMIYASGATTLSKLAIGTAAQILVTNGGATAPAWHTLVTADVTDLSSATTGITKVGTITTGVWNAGILNGIYGGTGVNNGSNTITLGGSLTTSGAFALTLTITAGTNVTLPTTGTLVTTAVTSLASLTSVGSAFAISGAFTGATTGAFSSTLSTSQLTITDTASRIIPGATSLSLRNNANNADNILISDAGAITVRSTIGGVTTITGTTATFTNLGGTLSTAAQANITSTGVLASLHATSLVIDSGGLTITGAATITGGAGNMTILSGTGASRTMIFQTTTSGSVTTTALTLGADQSATFAAGAVLAGALSGVTTLATSSTINSQTISATANFTGTATFASTVTVTAGGLTVSSGTSALQAVTTTGTITSSKDGLQFTRSGASTAVQYMALSNTSGDLQWGVENSTGGGLATGTTAYSGVITTSNAKPLHLAAHGGIGITLNSTGGASTVTMPAYGAGAATFDASGNITSASDLRLKHVVGRFEIGLEELMTLETILYRWREGAGETQHVYAGFSAQNAKQASEYFTGVQADGMLTLQDRAILAATVNSIQQVNRKVDELVARMN